MNISNKTRIKIVDNFSLDIYRIIRQFNAKVSTFLRVSKIEACEDDIMIVFGTFLTNEQKAFINAFFNDNSLMICFSQNDYSSEIYIYPYDQSELFPEPEKERIYTLKDLDPSIKDHHFLIKEAITLSDTIEAETNTRINIYRFYYCTRNNENYLMGIEFIATNPDGSKTFCSFQSQSLVENLTYSDN